MDENDGKHLSLHRIKESVDFYFSILSEAAMITTEHTKEDLSRAYVTAAAGVAGCLVAIEPMSHDYGIDVTFEQVTILPERENKKTGKKEHPREPSGYMIRLQMKATCDWDEKDGEIIYDLEADTYNMLVRLSSKSNTVGHLLAVMCLPKSPDVDWAIFEEEVLRLRRCVYYLKIEGPEVPNTSTKRVKIPIGNRLTNEAITAMFDKLVEGGKL